MSHERTITINGAGVAGLTLAIGLARFGFRVVVTEKRKTLSQSGAGLQISPNARRVLNAFGLDERIRAASFEPDGIRIFRHPGNKPVCEVALGEHVTSRYDGLPYCVAHRADLMAQLFAATRNFPGIEILFGVTATAVEDHPDGVSVIIEQGERKLFAITARAHIGADGIYSPTRVRLPGGGQPDAAKFVAWRAMTDIRTLAGHVSSQAISLFWGRSCHMVVYPLPRRQQFNVVLITRSSSQKAAGDGSSLRLSDMPGRDALPPLTELICDCWSAWPLFGISTQNWYKGNMAIMGDAAHAMLPFQAQGAAMAIEDAGLLAVMMAMHQNNQDAFSRWVDYRYRRTLKIRKASQKNGIVFHLPGPMSQVRDALLARFSPEQHLARLDWIYGHDPFEGLLLDPE